MPLARLLPVPLRLARFVALAAALCAALPVVPVPASARIEQADADDTDAEAGASPDAGRPIRPVRHAPPPARLADPVTPPGPARPVTPPLTPLARDPSRLRC
jgi:hypothetical protein